MGDILRKRERLGAVQPVGQAAPSIQCGIDPEQIACAPAERRSRLAVCERQSAHILDHDPPPFGRDTMHNPVRIEQPQARNPTGIIPSSDR